MELEQNIGIFPPEALIPDRRVNMRKWAVIACDQYTTNETYWRDVEKIVGGSPSTLHITLPEIYLSSPDRDAMIDDIKATMSRYLDDGIVTLLPKGFILVERTFNRRVRKGLMVTVDLEKFDEDPFKKSEIRASEEVLDERVDARIEIRSEAELEVPHVILLMDDPHFRVIEPIWRKRESFTKIYDVDLMMHGGRATGYLITDKKIENDILTQLSKLKMRDGMRFCVGDGNHSFATAKAVWEETKKGLTPEEMENHPLRYIMCELINLHDPAMDLLPIHRVISGASSSMCIQYIVDHLNSVGADARLVFSRRKPSQQVCDAPEVIFFTSKSSSGRIEVYSPTAKMLINQLQPVLEDFVREYPLANLEYIHSNKEFEDLTQEYDTLGFQMPALNKSEFFDSLSEMGVFPKKCFSLGEANEKRYYIEARLISEPAEREEDKPAENPAEAGPVKKEEQEETPPQKEKGFLSSLFRKNR
ncbi:MAG: DUF1015 domain-containing protein [Clostridia bacterium]|nr:DUF1015 domain-containing protein [Clostridia bacterium]MBR6135860.1 DUF1015 domain-containing protein [Clostridia bacterium]